MYKLQRQIQASPFPTYSVQLEYTLTKNIISLKYKQQEFWSNEIYRNMFPSYCKHSIPSIT